MVVDRGKANVVLRKAQECGAKGGTIFLGEGSVQSKLLQKIGVTESHKEVLMISASNKLSDKLHEMVGDTFMLSKRNRGIAFSIPFKRWQLSPPGPEQTSSPKEIPYSHFCIMTIVDKGKSRNCIKAARAAGAKGGTMIHGHGAGIPTDYYFPLVIEPRKDIVFIVTPKDKMIPIREKIFTDLELEKPGNGILFVLPVTRTSGLLENRSEEQKGVTS
jgi:nitrogen regulatory protein PII